jgi:FkbM family methyltransferase
VNLAKKIVRKLLNTIKGIIMTIERYLFLPAHQKTVDQWFADDGDARFRFDYPLDERSVVLDFGGYTGQWTSDLYSRYRCKITVFEPVPSFSSAIEARFMHNDDVSICPFGLGASARTETISLSADASSMFRGSGQSVGIKIEDAKEWLDQAGFEEIALIKVNIEGGEYELLERLIEIGFISKIRDLQIQFHDIFPSSKDRMRAIQAELSRTHSPTYQYEFVWENWSRK